jgi:hypothetical protein
MYNNNNRRRSSAYDDDDADSGDDFKESDRLDVNMYKRGAIESTDNQAASAKRVRKGDPCDATNDEIVSGENPKRFREVVQWHFQLVRLPKDDLTEEQRSDIASVGEYGPYCDFAFCELPRDMDKNLHSCVVHVKGADANPVRHMKCGCSTTEHVFPTDAIVPSNADDVREAQRRWEESYKSAQVAVGEFKHTRDPKAQHLECAEWLRYCTTVINSVRPHVMRCFDRQLSAECQPAADEMERETHVYEAGGKTLADYVQLMKTWENMMTIRSDKAPTSAKPLASSGASLSLTDVCTPMWCYMHQKVGHLVPVLGFRGYNSQCFVCPKLATLDAMPQVVPASAQIRTHLDVPTGRHTSAKLSVNRDYEDTSAQHVNMFD